MIAEVREATHRSFPHDAVPGACGERASADAPQGRVGSGSRNVSTDASSATLTVNPAMGDGKVLALYRSWRYQDLGQSRPSPASPILTVMIRADC
jgi:hypothetical protein